MGRGGGSEVIPSFPKGELFDVFYNDLDVFYSTGEFFENSVGGCKPRQGFYCKV